MDIIVSSKNPEALDKTIQQLGGVVMQNSDGTYPVINGGYRVRALNGNIEFLRFAIINQGYGQVLGNFEEPTK